MSGVVYRDIGKEDVNNIIDLMQSAWRFETIIHSHKARMTFLHVLLSATMLTSSWGQVAILDNNLVGFAMGVAKKDKRRLLKLYSAVSMIAGIVGLMCLSRKDANGIGEYLKVPRIYSAMRKGRVLSAEITFLVVSKDAQGLGIGKHLVSDLMKYFHAMGVATVGVFTDSESDFGFYDHLGFLKIDERAVKRSGDVQGLNDAKQVFLYEMNCSCEKV